MASIGKRKSMAEINVVPYIDVMLVLLVVFMVTAPLLVQGVKVDLPRAATDPIQEDDSEPIIVSVKADGTYYLNLGGNQEEPRAVNEITDFVSKILRQRPETPVLIWGDTAVPYGAVVSLMADLQAAGAPSVGLVTEPPEL